VARDGTYSGGKQWVKGQTGNPNGQPPLDPFTKRVRIESRETVAKLYWDCVNLTKQELVERLKATPTIFEEGVLRAIVKDMEKGTTTTLDKLMERVLGKPKEIIEMTSEVRTESSIDVSKLTTQELENFLALMKKGAIKNSNGET